MFRAVCSVTRRIQPLVRGCTGAAESVVSERQATAVPPPEPCTSKTKSEPFILLEEQKYVVPTFDLQRRLGNVFAQFRYRKLFEKEFTVEGFLNGAIQAAELCARHIRHGDWGNLRRIMTEEAVSELQLRFDPFDEDYFKPLNFSINDVICSVIDSSYTCGKMQPDKSGLRKFFPMKHRAFYTQAIIYIKKTENIDMSKSIEHLLRVSPPRSMLICNITYVPLIFFWKLS